MFIQKKKKKKKRWKDWSYFSRHPADLPRGKKKSFSRRREECAGSWGLVQIIHADKLLWKWLTFPIKDVSITLGGR